MKKFLVFASLIVMLGLFAFARPQALLASDRQEGPSPTCAVCTERTETRHQDWVVETGWGEWQSGDTSESNGVEFQHKGHSHHDAWESGKSGQTDEIRHRHSTDTSHWGEFSGWSSSSCTTSETKKCESKVEHKLGCGGEWLEGACTPVTTTTPDPTPVPQGNGFGLPGDGRSDGQSDGRSSCPDCTKAPSGQVLGASTDFAGTGSAVDMLVNAIGAAGGLSTAVGLALIGKKKS
jgi:hypothetical protein